MKSTPSQPDHSSFAPSAAKRWIACPGSVRLLATLPKKPAGQAAIDGTAMHKMAEDHLKKKSHIDSYREGDTVVVWSDGELHQIRVSQDMIDGVRTYTDFVEAKASELGVAPEIEVRVSLEAFGMPEIFGTVDAKLSQPFGSLFVGDLKGGKGLSVDAEDNPQLLIYAAGAAGEMLDTFDGVELAIVQPRDRDMDKPSIRPWKIDSDFLGSWIEDTLRPAYELAKSEDPPLVPGDEQCRWCDAKTICPALTNLALAPVQKEFNAKSYFADQQVKPAMVAPPSPAQLDSEEIARILPVANVIISWAKAVQEEATTRLEAGEAIPGYKLVCGRGTRTWRNEEEALAFFKKKRIKQEDMYGKNLVSPAKAEKLFAGNKKALEELAGLIQRTEGKLTLAEESDKRQAVGQIAADAAFEEFYLTD